MNYEKKEVYNLELTEELKERYRYILSGLGEDETREGLLKTPERAAKAMQFLTHGYQLEPAEILKSAMFKEDYNELLMVDYFCPPT